MYIIENALVKMIRDRSFYAYLVQNCVLHVTNEVPTAGVNVSRGKLNLYVNPYFWDAIGSKFGVVGQAKVLEHEMMHIAMGHLFRYKEISSVDGKASLSHQASNICMDTAINQYLEHLPSEFLTFDKAGKVIVDEQGTELKGSPVTFDSFKQQLVSLGIDTSTLSEKREFEHYLSFLKDNMDKLPKGSESMHGFGDTIDDHSKMGETSDSLEDIKASCKSAMQKALQTAKNAGVGNLDKVEDLLNTVFKADINWKTMLSQFLGNSSEILKEQTRKKRHRRYGLVYPGDKILPKLSLVIGIDTSGSVGQAEKEAFFQQINHIVDEAFEITLVDCDSDITNVRAYDKKNSNISFKGGGGTNYLPFFDYAKANKADALIILGDGYCFDTELLEKPKIPTLWAITEGGKYPVDWGTKLTISLPKV